MLNEGEATKAARDLNLCNINRSLLSLDQTMMLDRLNEALPREMTSMDAEMLAELSEMIKSRNRAAAGI